MGMYEDLEESLLREFNSSTKESIEDIALDEEEKNKIIYDLSGTEKSRLPELRVDYSEFSNHVFFGSAYSSVNFALKRIIDYPLDGQLKDVDDWKSTNSGYENWFYDQFPKDHGHIFLQSGSASEMAVQVRDFEQKVNIGTGSFTLEAVVKPWEDLVAGDLYPVITIASTSADLVTLRFIRESNDKYVEAAFGVAGSSLVSVSASYNGYISGTHHVAAVCNRNDLFLYIDGEKIVSASVGTAGASTGSLNYGIKNIDVGKAYYEDTDETHYYSGSIDEVRIWASARPGPLVKRNFKRTTFANHSSSLQLYWKFNEPYLTSSNVIADYSGNDLDGAFSGTYTISTNYVSGNIESFLRDSGDLIFDFTNGRIKSFLEEQRNSGSLYDSTNSNYIFELIPQHLIDQDNSEDTQKFMLLIARHWDRLKLYIQHLGNFYNTSVSEYNDTPDDFLNFVGKHYGIDIGGVYEGSNPLQYFYGEDVLSTGSMDNSIKDIKNRTKRNLLNNLIHLYKTKSTKESIKAALRALGIDEEAINVSQYSIFSGGLETTWEGLTVERRALYFSGTEDQYVTLHTSSYSDLEDRTYQFRFNLGSSSYASDSSPLTSALWRIEEAVSSSAIMNAEIRRENISSSLGALYVYHSSSADSPVSSSLFSAYDDRWINVAIHRTNPVSTGTFGFNVSAIDRDEIDFHFSGSGTMAAAYNPAPAADIEVRLGSLAGQEFFGNMQEVRVWRRVLTSSAILENQTKDFESLELGDFFEDIDANVLMTHLKLDDVTGSITTDQIHDYLDSKSGSNFTGFSSSAQYNFPGLFIRKLQPSYQYDFNVDNDKIRIKDSDVYSEGDVTEDLQMISVDFSPVTTLNKEIIKWFGGIEKFSNIIGYPYLKYREEVTELNAYRNKFFSERVVEGIDFEAYLDIVKWFDSNFSYFLKQLIPLDISPFLSTFVVEPHILEYNKVKTIFPYADESSSRMIEGSASILRPLTASSPTSIPTADPGRFGAFGSASAAVQGDVGVDYSSSYSDAVALNYKNRTYRKKIRDYLSGGGGTGLPSQYGNGHYWIQISSSNWEREVLNVNTQFHISGVHYSQDGGGSVSSAYLSSSDQPIIDFTGALNGVQDSRWQWYTVEGGQSRPRYDHGIGYGGGIGQLWEFCQKSKIGETWMFSISGTANGLQVGKYSSWEQAEPEYWVETSGEPKNRESVILWPTRDSFNGTRVTAFQAQSQITGTLDSGQPAASFGPSINIENFTNLAINIVGNASAVPNKSFTIRVKFQFFDEDVGESGFETVLSSSRTPEGKFQTQAIDHEYVLDVPFKTSTAVAETFNLGFERELPRTKNMRVYLIAATNNGNSTDNAVYTILVKGILSRGEEKSKEILFTRGL